MELWRLTANLVFRDQATLKLGQGRRVSILTFGLLWCVCGTNMKALAQGLK